MDSDGNLALAFNISDGSSTYPSIGLAGRQAADAPGILTTAEAVLRSGTSAQTVGHSPAQWGGSSSVSVNPDDDCTFWATAAFAGGGAWSTGILSFRFPSCATGETDPDHIFSCGLETGDTGLWSGVFPETP